MSHVVKVKVCDDFPAEFYSALCRLVVAFGRIEYIVKLTVKSLSEPGFIKGMTVAESQGQFRLLCKKGEEFAKMKLSPERYQVYCELLQRAKKLAVERNDNVHCLWTTEQGEPVRYRPFYNNQTKALEWRSKAVPAAELERLAAEMEGLAKAIDSERKSWTLSAPT